MFGRWREVLLARIIGIMIHKHERLTQKEGLAETAFRAKLSFRPRKTREPVIVALIGLVGSGKTFVAGELAERIGATVIEADDIRTELRRQGRQRYEHARAIAENATLEVIRRGGNVVIDSDFVDTNKRASIREKARKAGIRLVFVGVYADLDVIIGRAITSDYRGQANTFFTEASSLWQGNEQSKGAVVKVREMARRLPLHYRWVSQGGGKWVIRKPPCRMLAHIDTTDPELSKHAVESCAKRLLD